MRVLEPKQLEERAKNRSKKHKKHRRKRGFGFFVVVALGIYVFGALIVPLPILEAEVNLSKAEAGTPVSIPWPDYGQAAIGAVGYGLLDQYGDQRQLPIASMAKVMTVVAVLKVRPLNPGEKGEAIPITAEDVARYNQMQLEGQSSIPVAEGVSLTQYEALQALLLPSANNIAEIIVRWAFGSEEDYLAFVNPFTRTLGMNDTVIADASGFNPGTKSTAADLTKLAEIAMNNPVIAEITAQKEATLPFAETVYNVNNLLGTNDIVGIKTGNTDEAGGCYMFAAKREVAPGHTIVMVGVIMGGMTRDEAMQDSLPIIDETFKGFTVRPIIATDQIVGTINQMYGSRTQIKVNQGLSVAAWADEAPKVEFVAKPLGKHIEAGDGAGELIVYVGNLSYKVPVVAAGRVKEHSIFWRVRHAGGYL